MQNLLPGFEENTDAQVPGAAADAPDKNPSPLAGDEQEDDAAIPDDDDDEFDGDEDDDEADGDDEAEEEEDPAKAGPVS